MNNYNEWLRRSRRTTARLSCRHYEKFAPLYRSENPAKQQKSNGFVTYVLLLKGCYCIYNLGDYRWDMKHGSTTVSDLPVHTYKAPQLALNTASLMINVHEFLSSLAKETKMENLVNIWWWKTRQKSFSHFGNWKKSPVFSPPLWSESPLL